MKNNFLTLLTIVAVLFTACNKDDDPGTDGKTYDFTQILADYVDYTVIPTYADMKNHSILLLEATENFKYSSAQTDLKEACEQWKATRKPWESSEAFLFGPATYKSLDPLLDSWPLDQAQLDQVLDGNQELTAEYVENALGAVLRGFHTVEYLLFRDGEPRNSSDVTDREREYLVAVTEVLRNDCLNLWASWAGVEDGSVEAQLIADAEIEPGNPFGSVMKNAGNTGSQFLSQTDAIDEILLGIIGIADEVANGKIADPVNSGNVYDVESWFSWNSLTDFQNNIRSIQNSYMGGYSGGAKGASLSDYVAEQNVDLDTEVKVKIDAAIAAIANIPEPFRNNLGDTEKVNAAIEAINEVLDAFTNQVRPLFFN